MWSLQGSSRELVGDVSLWPQDLRHWAESAVSTFPQHINHFYFAHHCSWLCILAGPSLLPACHVQLSVSLLSYSSASSIPSTPARGVVTGFLTQQLHWENKSVWGLCVWPLWWWGVFFSWSYYKYFILVHFCGLCEAPKRSRVERVHTDQCGHKQVPQASQEWHIVNH